MVDQGIDQFIGGAADTIRKAEALVRMKYGGAVVSIQHHVEEVTDPNSGLREFEPTGEITITVKRD